MTLVTRWRGCAIFERALPCSWTLRKFAREEIGAGPGRGCYFDEHELERDERPIGVPHWEWGEWDRHSLVWAESGLLKRARLSGDGIIDERVLADFTPISFAARAAPD